MYRLSQNIEEQQPADTIIDEPEEVITNKQYPAIVDMRKK
jgi:hypothetical protein